MKEARTVHSRCRRGCAAIAFAVIALGISGCSSRRKPNPAKVTPPKLSQTLVSQPIPQSLQQVLARWNSYRTTAGLPMVGPDSHLDDAAWLHCRYLVKNQIRGADTIFSDQRRDAPPDPDLHVEQRGNQWFSNDGNKWASGAMVRVGEGALDPGGLIDRVMTTGFTAMNFLNPQLDAVGVGEYCENGICADAIVLDEGVSRQQLLALYQDGEWTARTPKVGKGDFIRARLKKPLTFPADNTRIEVASYRGGGMPDPLTSCPGYADPSGVAMFLEMGTPMSDPDLTTSAVSLTDNGAELETCVIDGTNYRNPNSYLERAGRWDLYYYGAVIVVPRHPLNPGHTYIVSVTAEARPHSWSFTVAPTAK